MTGITGDPHGSGSWLCTAAAGSFLLSEIVYEVSYYFKGRVTVSTHFVLETADFAEVVLVTYAECARVVGRRDLALLPAFGSRFAVVTSRKCLGTVGFRQIGGTCRTPADCL